MTHNLSLAALKQSYASGEKTARELILSLRQQALEQSEFNAWIYLLSDEELAPYFVQLEEKDPSDLPLYGVPFAIKDNIDLADVPTSAACPDFTYIPEKSAFVVQALINAGAIPLGKTNMDQFATGLVGTRSPMGQGKNVFNQEYVSGGSSSGSAISTALGQVTFALGTDTAGSGRVPAAFNNLIGLKPSKGLLSVEGVVPACKTLDCVSIFALNTSDAADVFEVASRYDTSDPFSRERPFANTKRFFTGAAPSKFRFAIPDKLDFQGDAECEALFEKSVETFIELGGECSKINFDAFTQAALLLYEGPWVAERYLACENVSGESMLHEIKTIIKNGNTKQAADAFSAQYKLAEFKRTADLIVKQFNFVLAPTTPCAFKRSDIDEEPIKRNSILGTYTNFMNLLDFSAVAVPTGQLSSGPFWGVTLFSSAQKDVELLNYASSFEQARALPLGATNHPLAKAQSSGIPSFPDYIDVVVCGAHLDGLLLNWQLVERGAVFKEATQSSAKYRFYALSDGFRPGMVRDENNGAAIDVEVWSVPQAEFGSFVAAIPAPLGIGKVELADGRWCSGFICENYGLDGATDVTDTGSWKAWLKHKAAQA